MIRLENVCKTSLQDVLKMSRRRFWKTSWRHTAKIKILVLTNTSWRRLLRRMRKANIFVLIKTSWRRLEDVFIKTNVCWVRCSNIDNHIVSIFENVCLLSLCPNTIVFVVSCSHFPKVSFPYFIFLIFWVFLLNSISLFILKLFPSIYQFMCIKTLLNDYAKNTDRLIDFRLQQFK